MGEDRTTHNFSYTGQVSTGSSGYFCDDGNGGEDETIRVGDCSNGQGNISWIMDSQDSGDEIVFVVAWQNGYVNVYIDGEFLGTISGGGSCEEVVFTLPDTIGSTFEVEVRDPTIGCTGDIQLASVCVRTASETTS